ncbi:MAG: DUF3761 domain-containing protein [Gemmatimonadaceae bacterium]
MTSSIRSLCAAGLVLGACVMASPTSATAQGHGQKAAKAERKVERKVEKAVVKADRQVARAAVRRNTRSTRNRYLCNDGSWWSSSTCAGHDGLASRQYKNGVPRASARAIARANANSAVARAYANGVRTSAIARCNDGTYWHGSSRTNACYRHGGVASWY